MCQVTHLGELHKELIVEASSGLEFISLVSHTSLELVLASFTCSTPSPSLDYSFVKLMDYHVIASLNDDLGMWILRLNNLRKGSISLISP